MARTSREAIIAVVIPCYKVTQHISGVLTRLGSEVTHVIAVDDACPEGSARFIEKHWQDPRLTVIRHAANQGVGGAVVTGFRRALEMRAEVVVKIDGDGQTDPRLVPALVRPLIDGEADYCKGNRFFSLSDSQSMPVMRRLGNVFLSFVTKLSSGYAHVFDPTNGLIAIRSEVLELLPLERLSKRFFFESDMLFHLGCLRAVVIDVPMRAVYGAEVSNLSALRVLPEFAWKNLRNFVRRILLTYFLRDFNAGSVQLLAAIPLIIWSLVFGAYSWLVHAQRNELASAGTVMLAALPILLGVQFLLGFLSYDLYNAPRYPLHKRVPRTLRETSSPAGD